MDELLGHKKQISNNFGKYQLIRELGQGGMGKVYLAYDKELKRRVALKTIIPSMNDEAMVWRFIKEARVLARFSHPHIIKIHDIGKINDQYYFVMDFIDGKDLEEWSKEENLTIRRIVEIIIKISEAIDHAHKQGVLHRDLKPENIMMTKSAHPLVMDFGLARELGQETQLSKTGAAIGTPSYMPPEQALGKIRDIDERSDVYSIGAVLYRLLTGHKPFTGSATHSIIIQVIEKDPVPPRTHSKKIPVDLESICLKAMAKEQKWRYQSAYQLKKDLQRFLNGEQVQAVRRRMTYALTRWLARNQVIATIIAIFLLILIVFSGFSYWQIHQEIARTREAFQKLQQKEQEAQQAKEAAQQAKKKEQRARLDMTESLVDSYLQTADRLWNQGERQHSVLLYAKALNYEKDISPDLSRATRLKLAMRVRRVPRVINMLGGRKSFTTPAFHPQGKLVAFTADQNTIFIWDIQSETAVAKLKGHTDEVVFLDFSPDGKILASASFDHNICLWDMDNYTLIRTLKGHSNHVRQIDFHPNQNNILASASSDKSIRIWNIKQPAKNGVLYKENSNAMSVEFSTNGDLLFSANMSGKICLWDTKTWKRAAIFHEKALVLDLAVSSDAKILAVINSAHELKLWDIKKKKHINSFKFDSLLEGDFHPYKRIIALACDKKIIIKDLENNTENSIPIENTNVNWSNDGSSIIAALWNKRIFIHRVIENKTKTIFLAPNAPVTTLLFLNEKILISGQHNGNIYLWNLPKKKIIATFKGHKKSVTDLAVNKRGTFLASTSKDKKICLWQLKKKRLLRRFKGHTKEVTGVAFWDHDKTLISASRDGTLRLWKIPGGEEVVKLQQNQPIGNIAISGAHENALAQVSGRAVFLLYLHNIKEKIMLMKELYHTSGLVFHPQRNILAVASENNILLEFYKQKKRFTLTGHLKQVSSVAFHPNNNVLVSVSEDKTLRLWDTHGKNLAVVYGHRYPIGPVAFSPSGNLIASGEHQFFSLGHSIKLWKFDDYKNIYTIPNKSYKKNARLLYAKKSGLVMFAYNRLIETWKIKGQKKLRAKKLPTFMISVAIFDQDTFAIGFIKGKIQLTGKWGNYIFNGPADPLKLAFHPHRPELYSVYGHSVYIWDLNNKQHKSFYKFAFATKSAALSPNGKFFAVSDVAGNLIVWDGTLKSRKIVLKNSSSIIYSLAFTPDSKILASGADDRTIRLWNTDNFKCIKVLQGHQSVVKTLAFSGDGRTLVSGSDDWTLRLWDMSTLRSYSVLKGHNSAISDIAIANNGQMVISAAESGEIGFWDISIPSLTFSLTPEKIEEYVRRVTGYYLQGEIMVSDNNVLNKGNYVK